MTQWLTSAAVLLLAASRDVSAEDTAPFPPIDGKPPKKKR